MDNSESHPVEMVAEDNVLVTGFGPFSTHKINASWEAVKLLPEKIDGLNVITEEVPVSYDHINRNVHQLWKKHTPKLVIHVGVSDLARKITLETRAHKEGYGRKDHFGEIVKTCQATCEEKCICSSLDLKNIRDHVNSSRPVKVCTSENAGRFLCEYIYYTSLSIDKDRTLFVHVPPLDEPYSAQELADGLAEIIRCALKQCR